MDIYSSVTNALCVRQSMTRDLIRVADATEK